MAKVKSQRAAEPAKEPVIPPNHQLLVDGRIVPVVNLDEAVARINADRPVNLDYNPILQDY